MIVSYKQKPTRTFKQYLEDNWPIAFPFSAAIILSIIALVNNESSLAILFVAMSIGCILYSYIDWKRNG